MWLSGGCTTSEPLPEGRPPPFACVYGYAFGQIWTNLDNAYPYSYCTVLYTHLTLPTNREV